MPAKVLLGLVVFDSIASYILWKHYGMIENNPIMLWALQVGWLYWLIKAFQAALVALLWAWYTRVRLARGAVYVLIVVFSVTWLQFVVGSLV